VAAFVRDICDPPAVARPARRRGIELPVRERKHVAAFAGHEPQLIPLAAEVGAVDHSGAVRGPVGPRLPGRLLVADLPQRRSRRRGHAPEPAAAVDMPAIRNEDQLFPVGRPGGREIVVPSAVVIARQLAVVVLGEPGRVARRAAGDRQREDVPASVVRGGDEGDATAVGRPARLDVHRPVGGHGPHRAGRQIEQLQLDRVVRISGEHDEASVRRPIGLIVVAGVARDLDGHAGADLLAPERALHGIDHIPPVGRPGDRAGTARYLRYVHLAPVIRVWHDHLLQHRLTLSGGDPGNEPDAADGRQPRDWARRHCFRNRRFGSSTSRSSRSCCAVGGATGASDDRQRSGHPTPACTSDTLMPGYKAASTISPVVSSGSRMALSVMTFTGPAPGIRSSRRVRPAGLCPGLVTKSTRSGNARGPSFATINVRRAWIAISAAPPDPGNRTLGRAYGPITVVLILPKRSTWAPPRNPTSMRPFCSMHWNTSAIPHTMSDPVTRAGSPIETGRRSGTAPTAPDS